MNTIFQNKSIEEGFILLNKGYHYFFLVIQLQTFKQHVSSKNLQAVFSLIMPLLAFGFMMDE